MARKVPRAWAGKMKKVILNLVIVMMFASILSIGQNNVLLVNGNSLNASSVKIETGSVALIVGGESRSIPKTDILCIIPAGKKGYTFLQKNNKKVKILKRDITNNYQGKDIARLFAYKYYKMKTDVTQIYDLNLHKDLTVAEFESAFSRQQQKIRSRATTSTILSTVLLIIVVAELVSTIGQANSLSYINLEEMIPAKPLLKTIDIHLNEGYYMVPKQCA